ncbi:MAG TPA: glycoside hydrolase family 3 protein, partial [Thermoanaerobaculia bacterium]|nr:glycoside hydrolase family 3 protein [Thermoanaerobaculia bacterium]
MKLAAVLLFAAALAGCATLSVRPAAMTLEEKVGQLFVYVTPGSFMNEGSPRYRELLRQVRENHVGGILWATWSSVFESAFLIRRLQSVAKVPLLVSADLEAGIGMRFYDTTYWPWPMAVAATGDPDLARREGEIVAEEARAIGLNQVYAPVADVNVNPDNPVINVRSFGEDPQEVARFVAAFVRGVESRGVIATVKHFPGHGDTRTDSHRSLPVLSVSRERLERVELVPFRAAIAAGAGAIMTAHLSLPALDDEPAPVRPGGVAENPYAHDAVEVAQNATLPASLSSKITGGLLRGELGFRGLVVTDALDMGGIVDHFDPGEAAVRAILAGADQVVKSTDTDAAIAGVQRAVQAGRITRDRLDLSVGRILAAKARAGDPEPDWNRIFSVVDSPEHRAVVEEIARRSVTLVRESPGVLPLGRKTRVFQLVVAETERGLGGDLNKELKSRLEGPAEMAVLDSRSSAAEVAKVLESASRAEVVLLALFVRFQSGKGSIVLPAAAKEVVERLPAPVRVVAVSFGSPYVLRELPNLETYL